MSSGGSWVPVVVVAVLFGVSSSEGLGDEDKVWDGDGVFTGDETYHEGKTSTGDKGGVYVTVKTSTCDTDGACVTDEVDVKDKVRDVDWIGNGNVLFDDSRKLDGDNLKLCTVERA